jgi:hypothetical protein
MFFTSQKITALVEQPARPTEKQFDREFYLRKEIASPSEAGSQ